LYSLVCRCCLDVFSHLVFQISYLTAYASFRSSLHFLLCLTCYLSLSYRPFCSCGLSSMYSAKFWFPLCFYPFNSHALMFLFFFLDLDRHYTSYTRMCVYRLFSSCSTLSTLTRLLHRPPQQTFQSSGAVLFMFLNHAIRHKLGQVA
jgi:hypothetical protein